MIPVLSCLCASPRPCGGHGLTATYTLVSRAVLHLVMEPGLQVLHAAGPRRVVHPVVQRHATDARHDPRLHALRRQDTDAEAAALALAAGAAALDPPPPHQRGAWSQPLFLVDPYVGICKTLPRLV